MLDITVQAARISALAKRSDVTQRRLAEDAGLSQPTLNRIMTGQRAASTPELVSLAWALGVPYEELVAEQPLSQRVLVAARTQNASVDISAARDRLVGYLRMEAYLEAQGVAAAV